MKLYVFYGGDIICNDISLLNDGLPPKDEKKLANPVFLIDHPGGTLLWDSGLPDALAGRKEGVEAWIFKLTMKQTLLGQLKKSGFQPESITYFALSHIHNDHTGNANYFKNSQLIMQEKEYEAAFESSPPPYNYDDIAGLKNSKVLKLKGDHDLFGDGLVQLIATPGHTAGHQSLLVKLKQYGPVIISGDVSYYQENFENGGVPTFNFDREASLASMRKIRNLVTEHQAELWIQHDWERYKSLKTGPEYYE